MKNSQNTDLWTALQPIYVVMKVIGEGQFIVSGPCHNRSLKVIKYCSLYKISFYLLGILFLTFFYLIKDEMWNTKSKSPLFKFTQMYLIWAILFTITSIFVANNKYKSCMMNLLVKINKSIDKEIVLSVNENIDNKFARNLNTFSLIVLIASLCLLFLSDIDRVDFKSIVLSVTYRLIIFYKFITGILCRSWIFSIYQRFNVLREGLNKREMENIGYIVKKIRKIRCIHHDLCDIVRELNKLMLMHTIVNLTINILLIVTYLVSLMILNSNMEDCRKGKCVYVGADILLFATDSWSIVYCCHILGQQINYMKDSLFKLLLSTSNYYLKKEISAFSLQILHEDGHLSPGGFFTIDMTFLFSMIGAAIGYIIILFQFNEVFK